VELAGAIAPLFIGVLLFQRARDFVGYSHVFTSRAIVRPAALLAGLRRRRRAVVLRILLMGCAVTLWAFELLVRLFAVLVWVFER
jgi:hypothetical protein